MSTFVIELTDNGEGVVIKAHAIHTTEQLQSGQTVTLATQLGDCLVAHLAQRMTTVGLSAMAQSRTQH
ncbi:hypothetical protein [Methylobacter sp.]|uniref:hypothetical protein n=1 Tax=Methylobacter sp. TaxID=2051955 RepID=UPI002486D85F|nr:hypothetical protein [Methylobacter sp.]MDI1279263.1 hypothetical protein [Methylobacter sp.]